MLRRCLSSLPALRGSYAIVQESDLTFFKKLLTPKNVVTDADILAVHNEDWLRKYTGQSTVLLQPTTTEEVSSILKYCTSMY